MPAYAGGSAGDQGIFPNFFHLSKHPDYFRIMIFFILNAAARIVRLRFNEFVIG
jgi:hypothetical protein